MGNVWGMRYRLRREELERWTDQVLAAQLPPELADQHARLLLGVVRLLRLHVVNGHGRCRHCEGPPWVPRIGRRRVRCSVYRTLDFAMTQPPQVVWRQLRRDAERDGPRI